MLESENPDYGLRAQPPSAPLSDEVRRRRARVRLEDMVGIGYFPDEVGLEHGWPEAEA